MAGASHSPVHWGAPPGRPWEAPPARWLGGGEPTAWERHAVLTPLPGSRAVDLIRHGGKKMRFLVAKSDVETAKKIRFRSPPP